MKLYSTTRSYRGFTLIELALVIAIIAILATVVIPKYINFTKNARIAALQDLAAKIGSISNAAAAQCQVTPGCFGTGVTWLLTIGTSNYQMWNGYPDAGDSLNTNEIDMLVTASNKFSTVINNPFITWQYSSAPDPANCAVEYKEALSVTEPPVITTLTSGC